MKNALFLAYNPLLTFLNNRFLIPSVEHGQLYILITQPMRFIVSSFSTSLAAVKAAAAKSALAFGALAIGLGVTLSAGTATAMDDPEDPAVVRVNMKAGGTLNVRKDPSLKGQKIGSLPAEAGGIVNLGCHVGMPYLEWRTSTTAVRKVETRRKWCNIEYNGMTGWTAGQYLEADLKD
ncbi:MAG: hypothetical protein CMN55_14335 [Sneathiella sp.]|nr:hypothetical protein [Sneathiella sp.]